jgi:hypothetical protein
MKLNHVIRIFPVVVLMLVVNGCEKDYYYVVPPPPPPPVSEQTATLEAVRVSAPPATINSSYWKTADYLKITAQNASTLQLYADGLLNMTGTYNGLTSFSYGTDPGLKLKAAYDNTYIYILAEWVDSTINVSNSSWRWNGPTDPLKADSNTGWTSQRNCDKFAMAFEINAASSPAGSFSSVGCAASCHTSLGTAYMFPTSGSVDLWNWNLAVSSPLGYAQDMTANAADSISDDSGQPMYVRNSIGITSRSGPAYEWDGITQSVTTPAGISAILDPGFYIFNKTPFTGNIQRGDSIFNRTSPPGDCVSCHGINGAGGIATAINLISNNKKTRAALISGMDDVSDMFTYWTPLSPSDKNDVVAYLRGLSGVPGYYLQSPDGSNADISAISNVTPLQIRDAMLTQTNHHATKYQVLLKRKLVTNNADDVQFNPSQGTYKFGVALMDNDGKNHIGSLIETLTFK